MEGRDLSGEFIRDFGKLESLLEERGEMLEIEKSNKGLKSLVKELEGSGDRLVKKYKKKLDRIINIRNLIVHSNQDLEVVPTEGCMSQLREIIEVFAKRYTAEDIMTRNVEKRKLSHPIREIIKVMGEHDYSQIPIVDQSERVIGLVTESSIINWLSEKTDEHLVDLDAKVSEVGYVKEEEGIYQFIPRGLELEAIRDRFLERYRVSSAPLFVLLVTHSGKPSEKLLGIITAEDVFLKPESKGGL
ncbi:MAG TPA: CBS domain-containing protein [Fimbriimonadales bacterium]|nr:CBS domain-containing protein [Fimbriimonadales bacterium]